MSDKLEIARRCSLCSVDWPDTKEYKKCPSCLDQDGTDRCRDVTPLDADEARSMRLNFEFERYYEVHDNASDPARLEPTAEDHERYQLPSSPA